MAGSRWAAVQVTAALSFSRRGVPRSSVGPEGLLASVEVSYFLSYGRIKPLGLPDLGFLWELRSRWKVLGLVACSSNLRPSQAPCNPVFLQGWIPGQGIYPLNSLFEVNNLIPGFQTECRFKSSVSQFVVRRYGFAFHPYHLLSNGKPFDLSEPRFLIFQVEMPTSTLVKEHIMYRKMGCKL